MSNWGERLRKERERINIKSSKLADIVGISRQSQSSYEKGNGNPSGDYWAMAAQAGIDVQYVLTGVRSLNWLQLTERSESQQSTEKLEELEKMICDLLQKVREMKL